jgi:hypothetical protein
VLRLAQALELFKPGLGDMAMVLAFTGLRWEEAVAVPVGNVSLSGQCMRIDRTVFGGAAMALAYDSRRPHGMSARCSNRMASCLKKPRR